MTLEAPPRPTVQDSHRETLQRHTPMSQAEPIATPLKVVFAEIPGYVYKGKELKADGQDGFAR